MALQLLKRNYVMGGYEKPKILKLPQGEMRWAPKRLPVDVGDIMMNIRMDDSKNRYIGENISKYAQGNNPYGEWGQPYKINKNNIRPPIIDPKFYQPLSRMPVKFDSITAGPIVKDLYGKRVDINKVAPKTITDKICTDVRPSISMERQNKHDNTFKEGEINLKLKKPHASIPFNPSMPMEINTGVPAMELDPTMVIRANAGIHYPYHISDQSRDINNMRTPMHVAVKPGYKDPYTLIGAQSPEEITGINDYVQNIGANSGFVSNYTQEPNVNRNVQLNTLISTSASTNLIAPTPTISNLTRNSVDLTPKIKTSAWYNPSYNLLSGSGHSIGNTDKICIEDKLQTSVQSKLSLNLINQTESQFNEEEKYITNKIKTIGQTNISSLNKEGKLGEVKLNEILNYGGFSGKGNVPTIQKHPEYKQKENKNLHFFNISTPKINEERKNLIPKYMIKTKLNIDNTFNNSNKINYNQINSINT